ncbi:hypothetical protein NCC49_000247 [Naganishia albida]|nr:hypothetical protein NCC49_000247 [Naganishia albida]
MSRSPTPEPRPKKVTPFLCRVFIKSNGFHPIEAFSEPHGLPLSDEHGVYVWKTSTLSTILASLYPSLPPALQNPAARFAFRTVYFDGRAFNDERGGGDRSRAWKSRELGRIDARDLVRSVGDIDNAKTLEEHRYQAGDYLCISVLLPDTSSSLQQPAPRTMNIRHSGPLPPQSHLGNGSFGREGAPQDSWIDARRDHQPTRGGFGIRGRGTSRGGPSGGAGGGGASGWGKPSAGDDSWGAVPKMDSGDDVWGAVPRGEDRAVAGERARPDGW